MMDIDQARIRFAAEIGGFVNEECPCDFEATDKAAALAFAYIGLLLDVAPAEIGVAVQTMIMMLEDAEADLVARKRLLS
jgi:hypothetical protein